MRGRKLLCRFLKIKFCVVVINKESPNEGTETTVFGILKIQLWLVDKKRIPE